MLDGKYEIISQRPLGPRSTLFDATAPSGAAVQIVWYDLSTAEETSFERYRKLLRALRREGHAAIYDLVARPGAHYVAWHSPPAGPASAPLGGDESAAIESLLEAYGWSLEDAHLCPDKEGIKIYGLALDRAGEYVHSSDEALDVGSHERATRPVAPSEQRGAATWLVPWLNKPWLPGALLTLFGAALLVSNLYYPLERTFTVVPDVRGQEVSEAFGVLQEHDLQVTSSPVPSSESAGQVLSSEPPASTQLRPGRTVHLRYALPPGQLAPTDVPELTGLSVTEAEQQLAEAGLARGSLARLHSEQPSGTVIAQSWEGRAPSGSAVHLLVSEGPQGDLTFLPDLTGMTLADATTLVRAAGLPAPDIERVTGSSQQADMVIAQNIAPYKLVAQDAARLRLTVTVEPPRAASNREGVPNFVGMNLDDARRLAQRERLRLDTSEITSDLLPAGVVTQNPVPGLAPEGGRIMLTVNRPPQRVPTPDAVAEVRPGAPRRIPYRWQIQESAPEQLAQVTVTTLSGKQELIAAQRVRGGGSVEGTWQTSEPGPVTFTLTLDGLRYGERVTVNP